jgi:hypothetical protein
MALSAEECRAHAETCELMAASLEPDNLSVSATLCLRFPLSGVGLRRTPKLARPKEARKVHNRVIPTSDHPQMW